MRSALTRTTATAAAWQEYMQVRQTHAHTHMDTHVGIHQRKALSARLAGTAAQLSYSTSCHCLVGRVHSSSSRGSLTAAPPLPKALGNGVGNIVSRGGITILPCPSKFSQGECHHIYVRADSQQPCNMPAMVYMYMFNTMKMFTSAGCSCTLPAPAT